MDLPGGFEPKTERVYNSKTGFKRMLGYGWGTDYEVYLETEGDGSVLVHHNPPLIALSELVGETLVFTAFVAISLRLEQFQSRCIPKNPAKSSRPFCS
ncbi:MAG: DUF6531 domain-containing protein [Terracidiphilus sp.]